MAAPTVFHSVDNTYTVYSHHKNIIGQGAYGAVYQGFDSFNRTIAAKCLTHVHDTAALLRDADNLRNLEHSNIVKIYSIERIRETVWIVLEHYANGNLNRFISNTNLTFNQKLDIMLDISRGMEFLHQRNLIHRNIKPQNILIADDSYTAKLTDYEIGKALDPVVETAVVTANADTLAFKSPEYFLRGDKAVYERNVDVFASALTFLSMLQYKPGSPVLIPHHEALSSKTPLHVLSIGQLMADRVVNKGLKLNIVLDTENEAVAASLVAAVVTVASVVSASLVPEAKDVSSNSLGFLAPIVSTAVAVVTTAFSSATMFGSSRAKLVALLLGWCLVAFILCHHNNLLVANSSFNSLVQNQTVSVLATIGSILTGIGITCGSKLIGVPLHEAIASNQSGLWAIPTLTLASFGGFVGSTLFSSSFSGRGGFSAGFGALAGSLGAAATAAVTDNPLSVLVGSTALGSAINSDITPIISNALSGFLFAGASWLIGNKLPSVLGLSYANRQFIRTCAYIIAPSLAVGISSAISYTNFGTALGVMGATAGVTAGFGVAGYALPGTLTNAGAPFCQSDANNNNGMHARRKRWEMRRLIGKMTSFEPRQRLPSSDVTKHLMRIRNLPS